jgi:hypothetical protein
MIKVNRFIGSQICAEFAGVDLWRLANPVYAEVSTSEGKHHYWMAIGFPTNMRSGSHLIDWRVPKFTRNNRYNLALLLHDFAYTKNKIGCNYISRELADELLRQMCVMSGELGAARAAIMHRALRIGGRSAYEEPNTGEYEGAENLTNFMWTAK